MVFPIYMIYNMENSIYIQRRGCCDVVSTISRLNERRSIQLKTIYRRCGCHSLRAYNHKPRGGHERIRQRGSRSRGIVYSQEMLGSYSNRIDRSWTLARERPKSNVKS